jgi:hypothetical protein
MLAKALKGMRIIHVAFVWTWFLFVLVIQIVKPVEQSVSPTILYAITAVAASDVVFGFVRRKGWLEASVEILRAQPENTQALVQWRTGNIVSFVQAETVTLFGVALKFLGASWPVAGAFFFVGLALLLLWTPRLDIAGA